MAIKDKQQKTQFKALNILTKEYKYENLLLGFVATIAIGFSTMVLTNVISISEYFPVIGKYPKVFAGILLGISILSMILVLFPFVQPALSEMRKVTWPSMKNWWANNLRVFIFMFFVIAVLLVFEQIIRPVMGAIYG